MPKIEGELNMNELGQLHINSYLIHTGMIIELQSDDEWIEVCIEEAHGIYYSVPYIDLKEGLLARLEC